MKNFAALSEAYKIYANYSEPFTDALGNIDFDEKEVLDAEKAYKVIFNRLDLDVFNRLNKALFDITFYSGGIRGDSDENSLRFNKWYDKAHEVLHLSELMDLWESREFLLDVREKYNYACMDDYEDDWDM